jgi:hypothetical protein
MRFLMLIASSYLMAQGTILDRTAIIVGNRAILDSQIDRDIRVNAFLNRERLDLSAASRKQAASRLIDQEIIREQIQSGDYPVSTDADTDQMLAAMERERFAGNDAAFRQSLARYGVSLAQLKDRLSWQMTVLRFIDARFRPGVSVSDQDIQNYSTAHQAELRRAHPQAKSDEDLRSDVEQILIGDRVNQLLDEWLKQQRARVRIEYLEKSLE